MMTSTSPAHTPADLGDTINRMDALSQSDFGAIGAIARSALQDLDEADTTLPHPEVMATALRAIWRKAEQWGNDINATAEEAGFNHRSTARS